MTPDDPRFNSDATPWPAWVTGFRDTQVAAMIQVVEAFNHGADVVMLVLSLIHISEPTRRLRGSRMPSSA